MADAPHLASSTAEGIFTVLNGKLVELLDCANPWDFCTSVGVDNTSVNIGTRNSEMAIFNFARLATKLRYYGDVVYSFYRKSAVEHDGGV